MHTGEKYPSITSKDLANSAASPNYKIFFVSS